MKNIFFDFSAGFALIMSGCNGGGGETVSKKLPGADFSSNKTSGDAPLTISFDDLSKNSTDSWTWDFGNRSGSSSQSQSHTYSSPESYTKE